MKYLPEIFLIIVEENVFSLVAASPAPSRKKTMLSPGFRINFIFFQLDQLYFNLQTFYFILFQTYLAANDYLFVDQIQNPVLCENHTQSKECRPHQDSFEEAAGGRLGLLRQSSTGGRVKEGWFITNRVF